VLTALNTFNDVISNPQQINQVTVAVFDSYIKSSVSRQNCIFKYTIYYNLAKNAIKQNVITYKTTWYGDIKRGTIEYDWSGLNKNKDEMGIDFNYLSGF